MNNFLLDLLAFASIFSSILVITSKNPVVAVIYLISVFINAAGYLLILGVGFVGISYIILYVGAITVLFLFVLMSINIKLTDILEAGSQYTKNIPLAFSIGILFIYELISILPKSVLNIQGGEVSIFSYPFLFFKNLNLIPFSGSSLGVREELSLDKLGVYDSLMTDPSNITGGGTFSHVFSSLNPTSMDTKISPFLQIESLGQELYTHGASWLIICSIILLLSLVAPIFISRKNK